MTDRPDGPPGFDFGFATGEPVPELAALRARIAAAYRADEAETVHALAAEARLAPDVLTATQAYATRLAEAVRAERSQAGGVDALMLEFSLDSREGVALMCVAEALLRIPDAATRDRLIRDKIGGGDWRAHVGASPSLFVNAAAWGLLVTGRLVDTRSEGALEQALASLLRKGGEPLIRKGVNLAMRLLGRQFVTGRTIDEALANAREREAKGYTYSFDMLGEAALTAADADRYFDAYQAAIHAIGRASAGRGVVAGPGVSVKLSALHPRYHRAQRARVIAELGPRLAELARLAKRYDIGIAIDAEEADRLDLSLDLLAALAADPSLADWEGLGFVVQCYQKRARPAIDWIVALARQHRRRLMLRLVKGAYWDSEIKRAQVDGMPGYPVFTRKVHTDVAYLACAKAMLAAPDALYPQFASHNAFTIAAIRTLAGDARYEFQCLHGMGESIYDRSRPTGSSTARAGSTRRSARTRRSSPISSAGSSKTAPTRRSSTASSIRRCRSRGSSRIRSRSPRGPAARRTRTSRRRPRSCRDAGIRAASTFRTTSYCVSSRASSTATPAQHEAAPLLAGAATGTVASTSIVNPADRSDVVGRVVPTSTEDVSRAIGDAREAGAAWSRTPPAERAACLERAADALEAQRAGFIALAVREAGKTYANAVAEVREAVDFLRYYAVEARALGEAARSDPSSRSRRGTSRSRSSRGRSAPRSRRATRCSRSPPSRRR